MNNKSTFTNEEIMGIVDMTKTEYSINPLTERKVLNIANKIDRFDFISDKEKLLALEYTARLRCEISFYTDFVVPFNKRSDYYHKQFITLDAMAERVYKTMYPEVDFDLYEINDEEIKEITDRVLNDLKLRMDSEKESLSDIHESTKIRKKIIKKRLGL